MSADDTASRLADTSIQDFRRGSLQRRFFALMQVFSVGIASARPTLGGQFVKISRDKYELMVEELKEAQDFIENFED